MLLRRRRQERSPIRVSLPNRSAPSHDGIREKRWIAVEPREDVEGTTPPNVRPVYSRRWLSISFAILVICFVGSLIFLVTSLIVDLNLGALTMLNL